MVSGSEWVSRHAIFSGHSPASLRVAEPPSLAYRIARGRFLYGIVAAEMFLPVLERPCATKVAISTATLTQRKILDFRGLGALGA